MRLANIVFVMAVILTLMSEVVAEDTLAIERKPTDITVSEEITVKVIGFGDLVANFQAEENNSTFDIGQAEIDLESSLTDKTSVALCIAYDEGVFAIGAFTLDWKAWERNNDTQSSLLGLNNVTVGGGQYDVPFGIDWKVYPSIDRKLVSVPLVVEKTHNGWNDLGGYVFAESEWGNLSAFVANGFCFEGEDCFGDELVTENKFSVGGRLGLTPFEQLEIGGSYASIEGQTGSHYMDLIGSDIQLAVGNLEVKAEYIAHRFHLVGNEEFANDGFYLQGLCNFKQWYVVGRYGEFRPDGSRTDISRFSSGIGRSINEAIQLRIEYQINNTSENGMVFQTAVSF